MPTQPDPAARAGGAERRRFHWRRFDTLGLRLFVLMWVTLVISHLVAYSLAMPLTTGGPGPLERLATQRVPTMPSLPPGGPLPGLGPGGGPGAQQGPPQGGPGAQRPPPGPGFDAGLGPGPRMGMGGTGAGASADAGAGFWPDPDSGNAGLPAATLWLDYGLRMAIVALGAALGARWLARPMRRLSRAAGELSQGLARGRPPPVLSEAQGTAEVREAARVFNGMASRLHEQFDARGMHLASVSHDLRTPLTRLRMRLENMPPEMEALAAGAAGDIHEMSEMIDSTLEVLHEQREGSQARSVDLVALLQALIDDLASAGHDVELAPAAPLQVLARPAALKRIAGNLIGNALRYGGCARVAVHAQPQPQPQPQPQLQRQAQLQSQSQSQSQPQPQPQSRSQQSPSPGGGVLVTVDDTGPGIPPDQLELAFRPWVRLTQAHARSGHGLGLAIARDLAERDGGRLTLVNRAQGGLQAALWLPLTPAAHPPPAAS